MRTEEEIREAAQNAKDRMEEVTDDIPDRGNRGGAGVVHDLSLGSYEALMWVLEEEDGHVTGHGSD